MPESHTLPSYSSVSLASTESTQCLFLYYPLSWPIQVILQTPMFLNFWETLYLSFASFSQTASGQTCLLVASPLLFSHRESKLTGHYCCLLLLLWFLVFCLVSVCLWFFYFELTCVFILPLFQHLRMPSQGILLPFLCHPPTLLELTKFVRFYQPIRSPQNTSCSFLALGLSNFFSSACSISYISSLVGCWPACESHFQLNMFLGFFLCLLLLWLKYPFHVLLAIF